MSEPTTPAERPPYWSDCENMNFTKLGQFIFDALRRRSEPNVPTDGSTPLSRCEFSDLVGLMQAKADAQKEDTTIPPRPIYDGPPPPPPVPDTTELLNAHRRRRNEARERVAAAIKFHAGQNLIRQRLEEVRKAEEAISQVQAEADSKKEEILQLRQEYEQAREPYERSLLAWEREAAQAERRRVANEKLQALVNRQRRRVQEAFRPKRDPDIQAPITRDFEIAPPGEQSNEHVRAYYRDVVGHGRLEGVFSQDRFEKMLALPRSGWQKGKAGFFGYIVLMFDHTERVLLECPVEGNAIYLLDSGDDRLLAMNKQQLRESGKVKRIFHTGEWYRRVKQALEIE